MTSSQAVIDLTRELIRMRSVNPPGGERPLAEKLAARLQRAGLQVDLIPFGQDRSSLVARLGGDGRAPLCLSGHLDTVALGEQPWTADPFAAEIHEGRLYGRGASDMKGGVAAIVVAVERLARLSAQERPDLLVIFTAGEETGCEGAEYLRRGGHLPEAAALVVAEPTVNRPCLGHRGLLWLHARTQGKAAHGSAPELGVNAIVPMAEAICRLADAGLPAGHHDVLGQASVNIGTIQGGTGINFVPESCEVGIDIRTVPGHTGAELAKNVSDALGPHVELSTLRDLPAVCSSAEDPFLMQARELAADGGEPEPYGTVPFCTDASVLTTGMGSPPTLICGPGEPSQAHCTDEYCPLEQLEAAAEIYFQLGCRWRHGIS